MVLQYLGSVHSLDHAWLVKHAYTTMICMAAACWNVYLVGGVQCNELQLELPYDLQKGIAVR